MEVVMSIAGSDSSGGAGIQADLKTFEAFGVFGTSTIVALTAQNTTGVEEIVDLEPEFIEAQFEAVAKDFDIKAIKIGMLSNSKTIKVVKELIRDFPNPIVLDPVAISKSGSKLLEDSAIEELKSLFKYATLITPNRFEAKLFFDLDKIDDRDLVDRVFKISKRDNLNIVLKDIDSKDYLITPTSIEKFDFKKIDSNSTHGTGCSFSSAICANLAKGFSLSEAILKSKEFILRAIELAPNIGDGMGPINHKEGGLVDA